MSWLSVPEPLFAILKTSVAASPTNAARGTATYREAAPALNATPSPTALFLAACACLLAAMAADAGLQISRPAATLQPLGRFSKTATVLKLAVLRGVFQSRRRVIK
ncbi:hypothetical protein VE04_09133 [Pseudogymnoascus sp. 24MN13]|nr:hypothetical protein VE04_09133 [Pseudogymnoascus sp. 24MN13]